MTNSPTIRMLATANNEVGDLFTRLTRDLFFALGYDNLRLDVHKSGRELDLQGEHRFEPRRVVGECKAHAAKMGGGELNKFFGALTRERKKHAPTPIAGYFVSLGGFTETGIEQEIETGEDGLILLDPKRVVEALESSHVIVGRTKAAERAGHCAQHAGLLDAEFERAELLGHQRGYLWAIFYARGKERTHFALIHADGTPLAESVAQEVIEADRLCGGHLHTLRYLAPAAPAPDRTELAATAAASYRQWLGEECGHIQLDGLPADADLSATRLRLERLFVPLKASFLPKPDDSPEVREARVKAVLPIGKVLEKTSHLALLAAPGGGKSTLLKRIATAYALPHRRDAVSDQLPERNWLPLFLRCRELRDRAHRPILELLDDIPRYAGMNVDECAVFRESLHAALRAGHALLLVDGLDEISDEGARQTFALHLRTFLAMFPQAALVVTSREAGFRLVAGVIASACEQAKLAPFDEEDVLSLCERWHIEVIGDNDKVRAEARELGKAIWDNERIRQLSENPLLLTTLLVVKRWIGELPRSRTALYREAIRVLVRTWNVEGFAPLDEEETLAQLSYVACTMMSEGNQQVGQRALLRLLQRARRELEAELQFARISPQEFIERIEYRSSLLMQTGHERSADGLEPVYEFRHLTFQEYLTARGYVEEQYPGRDSGKSFADMLEPHFEDERWQEVIPLAAVLAGRKAEDLIKKLIAACERQPTKDMPDLARSREVSALMLYGCIRDEVQITAATLRAALMKLIHEDTYKGKEWSKGIHEGKFSAVFQEVAEKEYFSAGSKFTEYGSAAADVAIHSYVGDKRRVISNTLADSLRKDLEASDRLRNIRAALACMMLAFEHEHMLRGAKRANQPRLVQFQPLTDGLIRLINLDDPPSVVSACWALAWAGRAGLLKSPSEPELILTLYRHWRGLGVKDQASFAAWAMVEQPLLPRDTFNKDVWGDCEKFLRQASAFTGKRAFAVRRSALIVGWYRRAPWSDVDLAERLSRNLSTYGLLSPTTIEILEGLGDAGRNAIAELKKRFGARLIPRKET